MGYGQENVHLLFQQIIKTEPAVSAQKLAEKMVTQANKTDNYLQKDDISCVSVYYRQPRQLMIVFGPPADKSKDKTFAKTVKNFNGKKIISGGITAEMIARELNQEFDKTQLFSDNELPPASHLKGFEIVTEGILTLNKVVKILEKHHPNYEFQSGPADFIVKILLDSDVIVFHAGTAINEAHQDPTIPIDLELRRTVIHRITRILENKFLKEVTMNFH